MKKKCTKFEIKISKKRFTKIPEKTQMSVSFHFVGCWSTPAHPVFVKTRSTSLRFAQIYITKNTVFFELSHCCAEREQEFDNTKRSWEALIKKEK